MESDHPPCQDLWGEKEIPQETELESLTTFLHQRSVSVTMASSRMQRLPDSGILWLWSCSCWKATQPCDVKETQQPIRISLSPGQPHGVVWVKQEWGLRQELRFRASTSYLVMEYQCSCIVTCLLVPLTMCVPAMKLSSGQPVAVELQSSEC